MEKKKNNKKSALNNSKKTNIVEATVSPVVEETKKVAKPNKHVLFKILMCTLLVAIVLSWIIPSGYFNGTEYASSDITRTGINEIFLAMYYGVNYYLMQIVFVLMTGVFYGVLSRTNGYKKFVNDLSRIFNGKEKIFPVIVTLIISLFVSISTQSFPIILFIPLIISISKKLGFSKLNSIAMTFGAIMVGMVGQTYSTTGIDYITNTMSVDANSNIGLRFGILFVSFFILNIAILVNKKNNKKPELIEDSFEPVAEKNGKTWPYALLFVLLFVLIVLGYTPWESAFDIDTFTKFHTWLTTKVTINIGDKSHAIFSYILGNVAEFGAWDIFTIGYITMIITLFVKLFAKIKFDDCIEYAVDGIKKMARPAIYIMFAYTMFTISYWSGFTSWIVNGLNSIGRVATSATTATYTFNPYTNALGNALASLFHVDFGYTGYALGAMYAARFVEYKDTIMTIMISMNGLMSFIAPTSVILLTGLSMYNVSYKSWVKYIWKLLAAILIILLVIFTVITYM